MRAVKPTIMEALTRTDSLVDFPAFVCRVVRSAVRDEGRRTGRRYDVPVEELRRHVNASIDLFRTAVFGFSRIEYRIATLTYQDGLSKAEVARLLRLSHPTVCRWLFSAQKRLLGVVKQRILPCDAPVLGAV